MSSEQAEVITKMILMVASMCGFFIVLLFGFMLCMKLWLRREKNKIMKEFSLTEEQFSSQLDSVMRNKR